MICNSYMKNNDAISFYPINSDQDYSKILRQISTETVIEHTYNMSRWLFFNGLSYDNLKKQITEFDAVTGKKIDLTVIVQPWQFADLIYNSIKYSNDFRGFNSITDNAFLMLLSKTNEFLEHKERKVIKSLNGVLDVLLYAYGFAGEQFKYQNEALVYHRMIKELYIIFTLSKKCNSFINPPVIIKEETGIDWEDFIIVLFGIYVDSLFHYSINESFENIYFGKINNPKEAFEKIVDYYSSSYDEIRESTLGRQIFYTKPFIKTQKKGLVSFSVYHNGFIVEHAPFWVLRNHYLKLDKKCQRLFASEFGIWFEEYFKEVCEYFGIKPLKIPKRENRKSADWRLNIGDYTFLIEQKSSIVSLSVKQQATDLNAYKKMVKETVCYSLEQLSASETDLKITDPIKIVLCYDDYIDANILPHVFELCPSVQNDSRYFLANINEIEMLFSLLKTDSKLFDSVIKDLLKRNKTKSQDGVSIIDVLRKNNYHDNLFWTNPAFEEYKRLLFKTKDRHKLFKRYSEDKQD